MMVTGTNCEVTSIYFIESLTMLAREKLINQAAITFVENMCNKAQVQPMQGWKAKTKHIVRSPFFAFPESPGCEAAEVAEASKTRSKQHKASRSTPCRTVQKIRVI